MSPFALVLYALSILVMLGGIIYYILKGSKGDLNPFHALLIIGGCILVGMILATLATFFMIPVR